MTFRYDWFWRRSSLVARFPFPASRFPLPASRFPLPASRFPLPASRFPLPAVRRPPRAATYTRSQKYSPEAIPLNISSPDSMMFCRQ
ncbi:hypothetical protein A8H32_26810 [Burkholderia thailandensis]|nr:hypothetical protein A8H32_26810 [Burkholderia thailandensis]